MPNKKSNSLNNVSAVENKLAEEIYGSAIFSHKIYILITLTTFLLAFIFAIPWKSATNAPLLSLADLVGCPLSYQGMKWNWWPIGPSMTTLSIPAACTGQPQTLTLENVILSPGGISYAPLGPVINISFRFKKINFDAKLALGLGQQVLGLYHENLDLEKLSSVITDLTQFPLLLQGKSKLDLRLGLAQGQLQEFNFTLDSENFTLPDQTISMLQIPALKLNDLHIKMQGKGNKAVIEKIILGSPKKDLYLNSKGSLLLNFASMEESALSLTNELKLSSSLANQFALISAFLNNYKSGDNAYAFKIEGTLNSPQLMAP